MSLSGGYKMTKLAVVYASYSLRMEAIKESVVCGHHIYKEVWSPVIEQEVQVLSEPNNCHDRQAVAIYVDSEVESNESMETHQ